MSRRSSVYVLLFFLCSPGTFGFAEPISTGIAVGTAALMSGVFGSFQYFKCKFYECCDKSYIHGNFTGLRDALQKRLYGQHLVVDTVVRALKAHLENENPEKALVMSFHGWTGGGKNYVSNIIAEHLFKKATQSQFYHLYVSSMHFAHAEKVMEYQDQLRKEIKANVLKCPRSLFIFDELDKINPGVLDALKPFLDYHHKVDGVDYRKSIFIFLSNTGGRDITQKTFSYWKSSRTREDIQLTEMEEIIRLSAFNEDGGLRYSELIKKELISHFIPFLPLEKRHVRLCVVDYFRTKNVDPTEVQVDKVADMLQYEEIFSTSGCKRVAQKVDLILEAEKEEIEEEEMRKKRKKRTMQDL